MEVATADHAGAGRLRAAARTATLVAALGLAACLTLIFSSAARAANEPRELESPSLGPIPPEQATEPVRDRVIEGPAPTEPAEADNAASGSLSARASAPDAYRTPDGYLLHLRVAKAYPEDPEAIQDFVDFFGSLLHGKELNRVHVLVKTPNGLARICGSWASACYFPYDETMVVPGEHTDGTAPLELIMAHEYGHHVAQNRANSPWSASDWGPKNWATYEGICSGVRSGDYFPGDEGAHYWDNPGEAWAQSYAFYHYPGVLPWWWNLAEPDQGAFDAIRTDVEQPWKGRTRTEFTGRLSPSAPRESTSEATPLDGRLTAVLHGPRKGNFDLTLRSDTGEVLKRTRGHGSHDTLDYRICGSRSVSLEVRRTSGSGSFGVTLRRA